MKIKESDIAEAVKESEEVEVSADHKKIRRKGNKAVPELEKRETDGLRKREAKAASKEEEKREEVVDYDEKGNPVLHNADFENP